MSRMPRVSIAGGSVGGLTAALVLRDEVFVYVFVAGVTLTGLLLLADLPPSPEKFWEIASPATMLVLMGVLAIHVERAFPTKEGPFSRGGFGLAFFWSGHVLLATGRCLRVNARRVHARRRGCFRGPYRWRAHILRGIRRGLCRDQCSGLYRLRVRERARQMERRPAVRRDRPCQGGIADEQRLKSGAVSGGCSFKDVEIGQAGEQKVANDGLLCVDGPQ